MIRYVLTVVSLFALGTTVGMAQENAAPTAPLEASPSVNPEPAKETNPMVTLKTSKGDITIELFSKEAPATVTNFLQYVDNGHYKGTIFHRVIDGFMIQGGGFTKDMNQKPTQAPIANEAANGLKNTRGTLAMARTSDPNSATAQFFINVVDNAFLDFRSPDPRGIGYCVFGKVVSGLDVVDAIKGVATGNRGMHQNVPTDPVEILDAVRAP
jgi:peptidyl-prolyl cis-trans isomerase B (cyclophilin B)